jgi:hypothetical protein
MTCSSSDTLVFNCEEIGAELDAAALAEFTTVYTMVREHGATLQAILNESKLVTGMLEGSSFCAAVTLDDEGNPSRGLISPEAMTVNMTLALLAEA